MFSEEIPGADRRTLLIQADGDDQPGVVCVAVVGPKGAILANIWLPSRMADRAVGAITRAGGERAGLARMAAEWRKAAAVARDEFETDIAATLETCADLIDPPSPARKINMAAEWPRTVR